MEIVGTYSKLNLGSQHFADLTYVYTWLFMKLSLTLTGLPQAVAISKPHHWKRVLQNGFFNEKYAKFHKQKQEVTLGQIKQPR